MRDINTVINAFIKAFIKKVVVAVMSKGSFIGQPFWDNESITGRYKTMKQNILLAITTIILLLLIAFFSRETVQAQREGKITVDDAGQEQLEKEHEETVKAILKEHNISNSGVMMTKVIYGDGKREYTVTINNRIIQQMTSYEQTQLKKELENITFPLQDCTFSYQFLETE